jgi:hypothetical protein
MKIGYSPLPLAGEGWGEGGPSGFPLTSFLSPEGKEGFRVLWIISKLVGRSDPSPCCPDKKAGAEDKKGRAQLSLIPPLCFRKEGRGKRDSRAETAGVRLGKRGTTAFFGEANDFLPGHGNTWP